MSIHIDWVRDLARIESFRDEWRDLERRVVNRTLYCRYDYVVPWYHCYASGMGFEADQPLVGLVRQDAELVAVAPMISTHATYTGIPVSRVNCAGYNLAAGEMLIQDGQSVIKECIIDSLCDELGFDMVAVHGPDLAEPSFRRLHAHLEEHHLHHGYMDYDWYAIADLSAGYEDFARKRGKNYRKQTRRIEQHVTETGSWFVDRVRGVSHQGHAENLRDRMFDLAEKGWRVTTSGLEVERLHHRFYRELFDVHYPQGAVDLAILVIDGKDAAYTYGLVERGVYYHTLLGMDEAFRPCSPGTHLLQEVFKQLAAEGIGRVLSHGSYDYKKRWASATVPQYTLVVFGNSMRGRLAHFVGSTLLHRLKPADRAPAV